MIIATGMAGLASGTTYAAAQTGAETSDRLTEELERSMEFAQLLKDFDATQQSDQERTARRACEDRALQDRRDRERHINNLRARITHLRSKIVGQPGSDERAMSAELSMLQTELFWLMSIG